MTKEITSYNELLMARAMYFRKQMEAKQAREQEEKAWERLSENFQQCVSWCTQPEAALLKGYSGLFTEEFRLWVSALFNGVLDSRLPAYAMLSRALFSKENFSPRPKPASLSDIAKLVEETCRLVTQAHGLRQALLELKKRKPREAYVFQLHLLGGWSLEEISTGLKFSPEEIRKDWLAAQRWLLKKLGPSKRN
ncbi:MAG: ECF-type sigma factor [Candidatus Andersenbacteria bacterium]